MTDCKYPQDLHIHTTFSRNDSSVVAAQTPELVARVEHAETVGISDHFEHFADRDYDRYFQSLRALGLLVGTEVDGAGSVPHAASLYFDYYVYHCYDKTGDYRALERLCQTGRPIVIAHPEALGTNLDRVPAQCIVEINNRYVWRSDWHAYHRPYAHRFKYVISSDAHQPNWLGQSVARRAARELGVTEVMVRDLLDR